jgi:hypothetical protein
VETLTQELRMRGIKAGSYHAQMEPPSRRWAETQCCGSGSGGKSFRIRSAPDQNEFEIELPSWRWAIHRLKPVLWIRIREKSFGIRSAPDPKWIWSRTTQSAVSYSLAETQCCGSGSGGKSFRIRATTQSKLSYLLCRGSAKINLKWNYPVDSELSLVL